MSTRSSIAIKNEDGTVESVYVHSDGYPSHVGYILQEYYNSEERIHKLLDLGDLSVLEKNIEPQQELAECRYGWRESGKVRHSYSTPHKDVCIAYYRDRGEEKRTHSHESEEEWQNAWDLSYMYIFKDGEWYCDGEPLKEINESE